MFSSNSLAHFCRQYVQKTSRMTRRPVIPAPPVPALFATTNAQCRQYSQISTPNNWPNLTTGKEINEMLTAMFGSVNIPLLCEGTVLHVTAQHYDDTQQVYHTLKVCIL